MLSDPLSVSSTLSLLPSVVPGPGMVASVEVCCVDLGAAAVVSVSFIFASGVDGGVVVAGALLVFTQGKVDCRVDLENNVVLVPLLGGVVVEGALFVCDDIVVVLVSFLLAVVMLGVVIWSATLEQKDISLLANLSHKNAPSSSIEGASLNFV